jgi:rubrerythrin
VSDHIKDFSSFSIKDAMDLAMLIEEEARDRYEELAANLLKGPMPATAAFFTKMARLEETHRKTLLQRRRAKFGEDPAAVTAAMIHEVEAPALAEVHAGITPREAMDVVLRAEQKAGAYFANALKTVKDSQVKALFESLRKEEAAHEKLVREEMNKLASAGA